MMMPGLIFGALDTHLNSQSGSPEAFSAFSWSLSGPSMPYRPRFGADATVLGLFGSKLWQVVQYCCATSAPESGAGGGPGSGVVSAPSRCDRIVRTSAQSSSVPCMMNEISWLTCSGLNGPPSLWPHAGIENCGGTLALPRVT